MEGGDGADAVDFEVMIEFKEHDTAKKTRTYAVTTVAGGGKSTKKKIVVPFWIL